MVERGNDNIYQNLKGVIWSAFIGIVSFQILAPTIWSYMHKLVGLGYRGAYWTFTVTYLVVVPLLVVTWLFRDYRLLIKYLPPLDDPEQAGIPYRRFLHGLIGYIIAEALITLLLLAFPTSDSGWFAFWAVVNGAFCLSLLLSGARITYDSLIRGRTGKRGERLRGDYWQMIVLCFSAYAFLAIIGIMYLNSNNDGERPHPDIARAGKLGFRLLSAKDRIDSIARKVSNLSDSLEVLNARDSLSLILAEQKDTGKFSAQLSAYKDSLKAEYVSFTTYGDHLVFLLHEVNGSSPIKDIEIGDSAVKADRVDPDKLELMADRLLDIAYKDSSSSSYILRAQTHVMLHEFTRRLIWYIMGLEKQMDRVSKDQLGKELRDTQKKGMFLFMGLFVALLALYIFLKISGSVLQSRLDELGKAKRMRLAVRTRVANDRDAEALLVEQEGKVSDSDGLTTNAWLFITITIWLLIPFFKPVEDEKIDTTAPFKMLTASGQAEAYWEPKEPLHQQPVIHYYYQDTVNEYNVHVDSIMMPKGKTDTIRLERSTITTIRKIDSVYRTMGKLGEMNEMIRSIKRRIDNIEADSLKHKH